MYLFFSRHARFISLLKLPSNLLAPISAYGFGRSIVGYPRFIRDLLRFKKGGGKAAFVEFRPVLHERTTSHPLDAHYFYQAVWASRLIARNRSPSHCDIGSQSVFVGMLTAIKPVKFVDFRPLKVKIADFEEMPGTVLGLPFRDGELMSVSSLHVIEHVGLGRYGEPVDPFGDQKAAAELRRILAKDGHLYVSLPIGRSRVEFNAHRVYTVSEVLSMFKPLRLEKFAVVTDQGEFYVDPPTAGWDDQNYACGMFSFTTS